MTYSEHELEFTFAKNDIKKQLITVTLSRKGGYISEITDRAVVRATVKVNGRPHFRPHSSENPLTDFDNI